MIEEEEINKMEFDKILPKDLIYNHSELGEWAILSAYRGSITHGMYIPGNDSDGIDDKDVMVINVPPIDFYFGLKNFGSRGTVEIKYKEWDIVIYEIRKFINLLIQGNPNVLSILWLDENHYIKRTYAGDIIINNRDLFVGRHVYKSFVGYAHGQLHRMTHQAYKGYMGEKRKALVDKYGYDTKNGAHLIRLLRMGIEFLKDGKMLVMRPDRQELLDIKRGKWSLDQVLKEADRGFKLAEEMYLKSDLPREPDKEKVNRLLIEIIARVYDLY